ncbi:acyltransferase family protein [Leptospira neocaledonica]|uniref:Acyltransferase n=1 Tax=Leptospira neocaledonica TaxID=2023192 RepID=A0A2M9ZUQ1_9LEPT|nr:acyltransferase family protein [Leptospira neocaledonica]PJZ75754.1 acyltransferase [Leptospira neocaledonica]
MKHNDAVTYRPDIDGLRAIAVLSVVLFHAFPTVIRGGFVGVDVFFVISGYLISSILFKNLQKGTFHFLDFYARRIRRIFPSLLVVLTFCLTLGYFVLLGEEYKQLGRHTFAGSFFFSNIALLDDLSDYFNGAAELKPLLHLWSLGIEEQFYIVWPLALYLAWRCRFNLFFMTIVCAVVSLIWNLAEYKRNPIYTFYLPYTRVWELLFGATLAWTQLYKPETIKDLLPSFIQKIEFFNKPFSFPLWNDPKICDIRSILGFVLIIAPVLFYGKSTPFPGFAALAPVLGAVLIISSGPEAIINKKVLAIKPMVFVGLISFPLYLWHWPLLSFTAILESGTPALKWRLIAVVLSFVLSTLTWHYVEKNLRFRENTWVLGSLAGLLIFAALFGQTIYKKDGWSYRVAQYRENAKIFEGWMISDPKCIDRFKSEYGSNLVYCLVGDPNKQPDAVLIGDSHANALAYGLIRKFSNDRLNLLHMGLGGCPPFFGIEADPKRPCERESNTLEMLEKNPKITKILLNSRGPRYLTGHGYGDLEINAVGAAKYRFRPDITDPKQAFREAMRDTLRRLTAAGKEIVFVADVPEIGFDPKRCVSLRPFRLESEDPDKVCKIPRKNFDERNLEYHELVNSILSEFPKVKLWETWKNFCDDQYCYAFRDGKLLYRDSNHISLEGSYWLGEKYDPK